MQLSIELQDVLQHSQPHISAISVSETALALNSRNGAFMSYDPAFRDAPKMPSNLLSDEMIKKQVFDRRDWVQRSVSEVARGLNIYLQRNADRWINVHRKQIRILPNLCAKPSIRGVLVRDRNVCPALVICRRSINFDLSASLPFLMRGGYELHLRDDPNFADFLVLDLTTGEADQARTCRAYKLSDHDMMSLEEFEYIVSRYAEAASLSKYGLHMPSGMPARDLFRR